MLGQLHISGGLDADAGTGGDVIEDHRLGAGVSDGVIHLHQAVLGGLIIVRSHNQDTVSAVGAGSLGQLHSIVGLVAAGAADDGNTAVDSVDGVAHDLTVLSIGQGGTFTGGAADDQSVDALLDLPVNELAHTIVIHAQGGCGGDQCGCDASENRILILHGSFLLHI